MAGERPAIDAEERGRAETPADGAVAAHRDPDGGPGRPARDRAEGAVDEGNERGVEERPVAHGPVVRVGEPGPDAARGDEEHLGQPAGRHLGLDPRRDAPVGERVLVPEPVVEEEENGIAARRGRVVGGRELDDDPGRLGEEGRGDEARLEARPGDRRGGGEEEEGGEERIRFQRGLRRGL